MDFGIAKLVSDSESSASQVTKTGEVIGTATCMSPEQARGGKVDHRSDLYALGCVMYECFASAPPFVGNNPLETMLMHLEKKPLSIKEASMGHVVDPRIEKTIFRLLEKDPDHRYQSMLDLKHDLEKLRDSRLSGECVSETITPANKVQSFGKKTRVAVIIAGVLAICAALTAPLLSQLKMHHTNASTQALSQKQPARPADSASAVSNAGQAAPLLESVDSHGSGPKKRVDSDLVAMIKMPTDENMIEHGLQSQLERGESIVKINGILKDIQDSDLVVFKGNYPNTNVVDLCEARTVTDVGLANLKDLRLVELKLRGVSARNFDWITNQSELKRLYISGSKVSSKGFQNIGKLKGLRMLDIDKTEFSDSDVDSLLGLADIEVMNISGTRVSVFGYDKLLNAFHKCNNLIYLPLQIDGQEYLSGKLAKVDDRPTPVIFKEAQQAMLKSQWREADVALERIIIRMILKEVRKVAALEDLQMLVQCEAMKGDCLKNMKLPYAAIYMYNIAAKHIKAFSIGDVFIADMHQRIAGVYESLLSDPSALNSAIISRTVAEDYYRVVNLDAHFAAERVANLQSLKKDHAKAGH
jgi:Leucine-rich repeat (LRR) protein